MSERILTEVEAGLLLAVLRSCDWDEPALPGLVEHLGIADDVVLRTETRADGDIVSIPAVALDPDRQIVGTMINIIQHRRGREGWVSIGLEAGGGLDVSLETVCRLASALTELDG